MKKRVLFLLTAAVLTIGCLTGCGKKVEDEKNTEFMEAIANDTQRTGNKPESTEETETEEDSEETESRRIMYATDHLNVRAGAGTTYDVVKKLAIGDYVTIVGSADADGWVKIISGTDEGYCKMEYLSYEKPSAEESASADTAADSSTTDKSSSTGSSSTGSSSTGSSTGSSSTGSSSTGSSTGSSSTDSSAGYTPVTNCSDYSMLPDNEYDRIDISYCEAHNVTFSVSSSGKVTWNHDASTCSACADDPFDMSNIYK